MIEIQKLFLLSFGCILFLTLCIAGIFSLLEREKSPARRFLSLAFFLPVPYFTLAFLKFSSQNLFVLSLTIITLTIISLFVIPVKKGGEEREFPPTRVDERDIMFSRNLLKINTNHFIEYYDRHPEYKECDDNFRKHPGLLKTSTTFYDPILFSAAEANLFAVESIKMNVDGQFSAEKVDVDAGKVTEFIKEWAKKISAIDVGITRLENYHLYTHVGRGPDYGKAIKKEHKYAIALTVEMERGMILRAPAGPAVMESSQQYLISGTIAVQLAAFIRSLGYPARAHIDGNYRVICPLVARDAGLGEIGRMGLLMTPKLGPRVRISVVTTNLPLVVDSVKPDNSVVSFCEKCRKCANVCPSNAIPHEMRENMNGVKRWKINSEACFTLWCQFGTDCGRCIAVCPYSHPNNFFHNTVRAGIRNSYLFGWLAIILDNFFYGQIPAPLELEDWMKISN